MAGASSSPRVINTAAVLALLVGNCIMMINQVNVSAIFTFGSLSHADSIASDFNVGVYGLGILTSAFFLSYGVFELPGGILAARVGPKKIILYGGLANAIGVLGSAASPQFAILTVSRFVAGFGFAFAFPSILFLVVKYYKTGSEGFGVALMSVSSGAGAVVGYFGWAVLGGALGWRSALVVAGALVLASEALMLMRIPSDQVEPTFRLNMGHLRSVIADKTLAVLCIAIFGNASTYGIVSNFMIYYLENNFNQSPGVAGSITSIVPILQIISSPLTGRIYDRVNNMRLLILVPATLMAVGVAITAIDSIYAAIAAVLISGVATGMVFTVLLAAAGDAAGSNPHYGSLTVAWVDTFSLLGGSASPLYFSSLVVTTGYPVAWLVGGSVALLLTLPVLLVKNESILERISGSRSGPHRAA